MQPEIPGPERSQERGPLVIVDCIRALTPRLEEFLESRRARMTVHFDGALAYVDSAVEMWANWARALALLYSAGLPVYLEVDPVSGNIVDLQVPITGRIARLKPRSGGKLRIELEGVACPYTLSETNANYREYMAILLDAEKRRMPVTLTRRDPMRELIDIRFPPRGPAPILFNTTAEKIQHEEARPVTMADANAMFALVSAQCCVPGTCTPPCITFLFPDCGCEARAHEMCRLMMNAGVTPKKYWNLGDLTAKTPNNPECKVCWVFHVAPTVDVNTAGGGTETYVIDPSLFGGPVTITAWLAAQQASGESFNTASPASSYSPTNQGGFDKDPNYVRTQQTLTLCRSALLARHPPPPYAKCLPEARYESTGDA